jgi:hypothetical protein
MSKYRSVIGVIAWLALFFIGFIFHEQILGVFQ